MLTADVRAVKDGMRTLQFRRKPMQAWISPQKGAKKLLTALPAVLRSGARGTGAYSGTAYV